MLILPKQITFWRFSHHFPHLSPSSKLVEQKCLVCREALLAGCLFPEAPRCCLIASLLLCQFTSISNHLVVNLFYRVRQELEAVGCCSAAAAAAPPSPRKKNAPRLRSPKKKKNIQKPKNASATSQLPWKSLASDTTVQTKAIYGRYGRHCVVKVASAADFFFFSPAAIFGVLSRVKRLEDLSPERILPCTLRWIRLSIQNWSNSAAGCGGGKKKKLSPVFWLSYISIHFRHSGIKCTRNYLEPLL